ncbi:MAG: DUF421 domain-containing protein [Herpetosiphon sp.]
MPQLIRVAMHTFLIYLFLIVGLRLMGRRHTGQLTIIDLIIIIVLGSAVETAMVAANTSLPAGIVSASTLLLTNRLLSWSLTRSKRLRRLVLGGPVLLVRHGVFVEEHLKRVGFTEADVMEAIRQHGEEAVTDVKYAVLEDDGSISVLGRHTESLHSDGPIISDLNHPVGTKHIQSASS